MHFDGPRSLGRSAPEVAGPAVVAARTPVTARIIAPRAMRQAREITSEGYRASGDMSHFPPGCGPLLEREPAAGQLIDHELPLDRRLDVELFADVRLLADQLARTARQLLIRFLP